MQTINEKTNDSRTLTGNSILGDRFTITFTYVPKSSDRFSLLTLLYIDRSNPDVKAATICEFTMYGKTRYGRAFCYTGDEYNQRTGEEMALERAMKAMKNDDRVPSYSIWHTYDMDRFRSTAQKPTLPPGWELAESAPRTPRPGENYLTGKTVLYCRIPFSSPARYYIIRRKKTAPSQSPTGFSLNQTVMPIPAAPKGYKLRTIGGVPIYRIAVMGEYYLWNGLPYKAIIRDRGRVKSYILDPDPVDAEPQTATKQNAETVKQTPKRTYHIICDASSVVCGESSYQFDNCQIYPSTSSMTKDGPLEVRHYGHALKVLSVRKVTE